MRLYMLCTIAGDIEGIYFNEQRARRDMEERIRLNNESMPNLNWDSYFFIQEYHTEDYPIGPTA